MQIIRNVKVLSSDRGYYDFHFDALEDVQVYAEDGVLNIVGPTCNTYFAPGYWRKVEVLHGGDGLKSKT